MKKLLVKLALWILDKLHHSGADVKVCSHIYFNGGHYQVWTIDQTHYYEGRGELKIIAREII